MKKLVLILVFIFAFLQTSNIGVASASTCWNGLRDNGEVCDPTDISKGNWGVKGCNSTCTARIEESNYAASCNQTFDYTQGYKLRHGYRFPFADKYSNNRSKDIKLVHENVFFTEYSGDLDGKNYVIDLKWHPDIIAKNNIIAAGEKNVNILYSGTGSDAVRYNIVNKPTGKRNPKDIQLIYEIATYALNSNGEKTDFTTHRECINYMVTYCGDGVVDAYTDIEGGENYETCDPEAIDPSTGVKWGSTCDPVECRPATDIPTCEKLDVVEDGVLNTSFPNLITVGETPKDVALKCSAANVDSITISCGGINGGIGDFRTFNSNGQSGSFEATYNCHYDRPGQYSPVCLMNGSTQKSAVQPQCRKSLLFINSTKPEIAVDKKDANAQDLDNVVWNDTQTIATWDDAIFKITITNNGSEPLMNLLSVQDSLSDLERDAQWNIVANPNTNYQSTRRDRGCSGQIDLDTKKFTPNRWNISIVSLFDSPGYSNNHSDNILQAGESVSFTCTVENIDREYYNNVMVSGKWLHSWIRTNKPTNDTQILLADYDLALVKKVANAKNSYKAGDIVEFSITVHNQGGIDATGVEVTDYVPSGLVFRAQDNPSGVWAATGNKLKGQFGDIEKSGMPTQKKLFLYIDSVPTGGRIINWAEISGNTDGHTDVDSTPDSDNTNDCNGDTKDRNVLGSGDNYVLGKAKESTTCSSMSDDEDDHDGAAIVLEEDPKVIDLALVKKLNSAYENKVFRKGDLVAFDITVYNQSETEDDSSIMVIDYTIDGLEYDSSNTESWVAVNGGRSLDFGSIAKKTGDITHSVTKTITFKITADNGTNIINWAEITGSDKITAGYEDIDSTPDTDNTDCNGTGGDAPSLLWDGDNYLDWDAKGNTTCNKAGDEDDHDGERITTNFYDLALIKETTGGTTVVSGGDVTFNITVKNQGTIDATGVEITDYIPAGFSLNDWAWTAVWTDKATRTIAGTIAAGGTKTVSITMTAVGWADEQHINWAEISGNTDGNTDIDSTPDGDNTNDCHGGKPRTEIDPELDNEWLGTGDTNGNGTCDAGEDEDDHDPAVITTTAPTPHITIEKYSNQGATDQDGNTDKDIGDNSQTINKGETAKFAIKVINDGSEDLKDIVVTDPLAPDCNFEIAELAVDDVKIYFCEKTDTQAAYTNTASVTAKGKTSNISVDDTDDAGVLIPLEPKITIEKYSNQGATDQDGDIDKDEEDDSQTINKGETAKFTIKVTNNGTEDLKNVVIIDTRDGVEYSTCNESIEILLAGKSKTYYCEKSNAQHNYMNVVNVTATGKDSNIAVAAHNDTEVKVVTDNPSTGKIKIKKYSNQGATDQDTNKDKDAGDDSQTINKGETAKFTIWVKNDGPIDLKNIKITDALAPNCDREFNEIKVGKSKTYTCELANTTANYTNIVSVVAEDKDGKTITKDADDTDDTKVVVTSTGPHITLKKYSNQWVTDQDTNKDKDAEDDSQTINKGETAKFTIWVKNDGDEILENVVITDPLAADCNFTIPELAVGEFKTKECTKLNTQSNYTNVANVTAKGKTTGESVWFTDNTEVKISWTHHTGPHIKIEKYSNQWSTDQDGNKDKDAGDNSQKINKWETAKFTIKVTNDGDEDLKDVVITDPLAADCNFTITELVVGDFKIKECTKSNTQSNYTNVANVTAKGKNSNTSVTDTDDTGVVVKTSGWGGWWWGGGTSLRCYDIAKTGTNKYTCTWNKKTHTIWIDCDGDGKYEQAIYSSNRSKFVKEGSKYSYEFTCADTETTPRCWVSKSKINPNQKSGWTTSFQCKAIASAPTCGDGRIDVSRNEECDLGNNNWKTGYTCTSSCKIKRGSHTTTRNCSNSKSYYEAHKTECQGKGITTYPHGWEIMIYPIWYTVVWNNESVFNYENDSNIVTWYNNANEAYIRVENIWDEAVYIEDELCIVDATSNKDLIWWKDTFCDGSSIGWLQPWENKYLRKPAQDLIWNTAKIPSDYSESVANLVVTVKDSAGKTYEDYGLLSSPLNVIVSKPLVTSNAGVVNIAATDNMWSMKGIAANLSDISDEQKKQENFGGLVLWADDLSNINDDWALSNAGTNQKRAYNTAFGKNEGLQLEWEKLTQMAYFGDFKLSSVSNTQKDVKLIENQDVELSTVNLNSLKKPTTYIVKNGNLYITQDIADAAKNVWFIVIGWDITIDKGITSLGKNISYQAIKASDAGWSIGANGTTVKKLSVGRLYGNLDDLIENRTHVSRNEKGIIEGGIELLSFGTKVLNDKDSAPLIGSIDANIINSIKVAQ